MSVLFKISVEDEEIKNKFRSYEELKKDFEGLNLTVKTDSEIMKDLFIKYNRSDVSKQEKIDTLVSSPRVRSFL